ncbi:hypothetical protein [Actinopolymorpha pittospori]
MVAALMPGCCVASALESTLDERRDPPGGGRVLHQLAEDLAQCRLIVSGGWTGLGIRVLNWVAAKPGQQGNDWIRMDVWTDNKPLHDHYLRHGSFGIRN